MSSAEALKRDLEAAATPSDVAEVLRFYAGGDPSTKILGVFMGKVFPIAKQHAAMPLSEVEALLDDPHYEVRMAAMAILDFKAREKRLTEEGRKALYDLYLRRHDRIDNWGLVDRAAPWVVGEHLLDKDRSALDRLARSDNPHERRTAIVATHAFIKRGETADTFRIAGILAGDRDDYVQKAIASWTREAGKRDPEGLVEFLFKNLDTLPRSTLVTASKLLPDDTRAGLLAK